MVSKNLYLESADTVYQYNLKVFSSLSLDWKVSCAISFSWMFLHFLQLQSTECVAGSVAFSPYLAQQLFLPLGWWKSFLYEALHTHLVQLSPYLFLLEDHIQMCLAVLILELGG